MNNLIRLADLSAVPEKGKVVIGFSGGADSAALTDFVSQKIEKERIICVHINHLLRADEAYRDEAAAQQFCVHRGLCFQVFREDVKKLAEEKKIGEEECGRIVRYNAFESIASEDCDRILTAHNADDNAETVLMNLAKGTALSGLCGIPYQRGKIVRPLLNVTRDEIEQYCLENEIHFVNDSSNESDEYTRNRVRHHIIPLMKEINAGFIKSVSQMKESITSDETFLQLQATNLLNECQQNEVILAKKFEKYPLAVRTRAIKRFLEENGCGRLLFEHIMTAANLFKNGMRAELPGGKTLECSADVITIVKKEKKAEWQREIIDGKALLPSGKEFILQKASAYDIINSKKINKLLFNSSIDCDTINGDLIVRSRREGDAFSPVDKHMTKTLKKLFLEKKIPRYKRDSISVLARKHDGEIIFAEEFGVAQQFCVTDKTQNCVTVKIEGAK